MDARTPVWEALHHLIRTLNESETAAGQLRAKTEPVRQLAYRIYTLCERNKWAEEARDYNNLIASWHAVILCCIDSY